MITIINMTPHPVTIIRPDREPVTYPACAPDDLPRALESAEFPATLDPCPGMPGSKRIMLGDMALTDSGSDGQGGYENTCSLQSTGLVDFVGYVGVEGLPDLAPGERMFGLATFRIVSIVTAIGAIVSGRGVEDLLVPMGQVRDASGRVIGASGLAPASSLLTPLYRTIIDPQRRETIRALEERNAARKERDEALSRPMTTPDGRVVRVMPGAIIRDE